MAVHVLDAETISRIAAGEVVERPASIVKELLENSIDAGATSINVEIREGGVEYIRVVDNGSGIDSSDARIVFLNHATSKLPNGDALTDIRTLGFRGEALPSIAAVSKVELRSMVRGAQSGTAVIIEGGTIRSIRETGCPEGTSIVVKDLFYNVPARKAFLKKAAYEASAVYDVVSKIILGNPRVAIRYSNNGKVLCHSFGDGKLRSAALSVFGKEIASKMDEIDESEGAFRIHGLIGCGELAKQNRSAQYFFINGRTIRCNLLTAALELATKQQVGIGLHAICALHVTVPAASIDVNVHPSKLEVRFRDEFAFKTYAESLLIKAVRRGTMLDIPAMTTKSNEEQARITEFEQKEEENQKSRSATELSLQDKLQRAQEPVQYDSSLSQLKMPQEYTGTSSGLRLREKTRNPSVSLQDLYNAAMQKNDPQAAPEALPESHKQTLVSSRQLDAPFAETPVSSEKIQSKIAESIEQAPLQECETDPYTIIGTAFNTYVLVESRGCVIIIDQHAAHERIMFERLKAQIDTGTASQRLLVPIILKMTPREMIVLEENRELLESTGYEVTPFGEREIRVDAVPFILGKADYKALFAEMIDDLRGLKYAQLDQRLQSIITLSCKKAVKGGDALSNDELHALIETMLKTKALPTCPHGRPVAKMVRRQDLEKMFART